MAVPLRCVVGQLSIVESTRYPEAENVLVVEPGSFPGSTRDDFGLYALIELSGLVLPPPDLQQSLLNILKEEFYQSSGSVSASLQQAVLEVNQALYDFNLESMREDRQGGGITCIALRESDLYIAQGGPAVAYLIEPGRASRFPEHSPWFDEDDSEDIVARPLGASRQFKSELEHCQLQAGDFIVLSESILGQTASTEQIEDAMFPGDVNLTTERLADLVGEGDDISFVAIEAHSESVPSRESVLLEELGEEVKSPTRQPAVRPSERKRTVGQRSPGVKRSRGGFIRPTWPRIDGDGISHITKKCLTSLWAYILLGLGFVWSNVKVIAVRTLPGSREAEVEMKGKRKSPTTKTKPSQKKPPESPAGPAKRTRLLKYVAVAIPVVVLVIVGLVYLERERTAYDAHDQLIQTAKAKYDQALSEMADVDLARSLFADALNLLDEAKTALPVAVEPPNLRKDILKNVDQLNQVERLYWIPRLHHYTNSKTDLRRIVVDGINVYVLDKGTNQVFGYVLNETEDGFHDSGEDPALIKEDEQVGDVVVGDMLDMNWMPAGSGRQTGNLVVVDKKGALLDYSPTWGVKNRPLAATDEWLYPQVISGFYGNLYVLDAQLNQVLKYLPTTADGGYGNPPLHYIDEDVDVDLTGVVDMAIDGHIYALFANGKISKFMNGAPMSFEVTGLDVPLSNPSAIFTNADQDTQYLYVADKGNRRVVQLTKDGRFQRQFKVDTNAFDDLRSLWVDELEQKMYIVSGNSVFITSLPAE